jgi:hypothetical protein
MRIPRPGRRLIILAAVAAGIAAAAFVAIAWGLPYKRHLEVQRQLAAYKAEPTPANAAPLVRMMANYQLDQKDADDILRTWLDLEVVTKKSYRPNEPIKVTLAANNGVEFRALRGPGLNILSLLDFSTILRLRGVTSDAGITNSASVAFDQGFMARAIGGVSWSSPWPPWGSSLATGPPGATIVLPRPGGYQGVLTLTGSAQASYAADKVSFRVTPLGWMDRTLIRLGLKEDTVDVHPPVYSFEFDVPFEIHIEDAPAAAPDVENR